MRILQIEDDSATAQSVELMLKSEGMSVHTTDLGCEGIEFASEREYDLILLDLNLPDMSGVHVLKRLRADGIKTPIMIQTGTDAIETKVRCLNEGADDYLTKPFHKDELVARARAVVRRSKGQTTSVVKTGNIAIDFAKRSVTVDGRPVPLTPQEYRAYELLAERKGTTVSKKVFLSFLYEGQPTAEEKIIDVLVCKLRRKIGAMNGGVHHIETVWARGYVLRDPHEDSVAA